MVLMLHEHPCPEPGCDGRVFSSQGNVIGHRVLWLRCDLHAPTDATLIVPFDTRPGSW